MNSIFVARGNVGRDPDLVRHCGDLSRCPRTARCGRRRLLPMRPVLSRRPGRHLLLPGRKEGLGGVLFGLEGAGDSLRDRFLPGTLAQLLPDGTYRFANEPHDARLAALAFALGAYRFTRYRKIRAQRHQARSAAKRRPRRTRSHRRRRDAGARSHQHAGQRHGPGTNSKTPRASSRTRHGATIIDHRRRRSVDREFSADSRGRPRRRRGRRG